MSDFSYAALIRTSNSFPIVRETIASLRSQTIPPTRIVVVDSGSSAAQLADLRALADVVLLYPLEPFNYSKAINLGIAACDAPTTLIISSHVVMVAPDLVERAQRAAAERNAFGFYLWTTDRPWSVESVTKKNFNGRNGLFNYCAFVRTQAVRDRPFREEVFSAEDQEWAAFHMRRDDAVFVRIGTDALKNLNPQRSNSLKFINEEVAIAYFTCREKLGYPYLASWLLRSALAFVRGHFARSRAHLAIFKALVAARSTPPQRTSKYF